MDARDLIERTLQDLRRQLDEALADGQGRDSYNIGWIEGAIVMLQRVAGQLESA